MSKASRSKGRKGQREAADLLRSRDWNVVEVNAGTAVEDFVAIDTNGTLFSVEVKNTVSIDLGHKRQAQRQAAERKLPWLLMSKIADSSSWLIQRKGEKPVVWSEA